MESCNLCKLSNINNITDINLFHNKKININYYFLIDNKYYQCICYNNCSRYGIYKDKNKWINYIGMLYISDNIVTIIYNNIIYKCINVEYIPKDNIFLKNVQFNLNNKCTVINNNTLLKINYDRDENKVLNKLEKIENIISNNKITLNSINNNIIELNSKYYDDQNSSEFDYLEI
jgi:hypothetical protein